MYNENNFIKTLESAKIHSGIYIPKDVESKWIQSYRNIEKIDKLDDYSINFLINKFCDLTNTPEYKSIFPISNENAETQEVLWKDIKLVHDNEDNNKVEKMIKNEKKYENNLIYNYFCRYFYRE